MYLIYSILYSLAVAVLFIPQYLKRSKDVRHLWLRNKFGVFDNVTLDLPSAPVWIHAVSVGEVNAALPFLRKLRTAFPGTPVILSTITDTGWNVAKEKAPHGTRVVYLPFDLPFILNRCFQKAAPRLLLVMETELWPNLFRVASGRQIPVVILNGRISEKSARGYRMISFFMKKVFDHVVLFCMQSGTDAERIRAAGAENAKIRVTGNVKFDMDISGEMPEWMNGIRGPVIVAGSTHEGEEQIVIDAYRENVYLFPGLKVIIAPRHPERFSAAEDVIRKSDMRYLKRTEIGPAGIEPSARGFCILLLDTVGELTAVYRLGDIAIMGKSFSGFGGQNPLEPAYWSKPIICGPHMENFPFMSEFYAEGAAFEVSSTGLAKKIKELLMQPEKAAAAGRKAHELYVKNSGAAERSLEIISPFVR